VLGAVYTRHNGATLSSAALGLGQVGIATGWAVHRTGGGGATQAPPLARQVANFFVI
jgi:hypothetical protein